MSLFSSPKEVIFTFPISIKLPLCPVEELIIFHMILQPSVNILSSCLTSAIKFPVLGPLGIEAHQNEYRNAETSMTFGEQSVSLSHALQRELSCPALSPLPPVASHSNSHKVDAGQQWGLQGPSAGCSFGPSGKSDVVQLVEYFECHPCSVSRLPTVSYKVT